MTDTISPRPVAASDGHARTDRDTAGPEALWDFMLDLRAPQELSTVEVDSPALLAARSLIEEALGSGARPGPRHVPSAGAIYPWTTLVLCRAHQSRRDGHRRDGIRWELFEVGETGLVSLRQVNRSVIASLVRWVCTPNATSTLDTSGTPATEAEEAEETYAVLLLTRPWLSMRKYGPRGYVYTQLDAGHAAVNLLGVALQGGDAQVRLARGDSPSSQCVDWVYPRHELHSAVVVRGAVSSASAMSVSVQHAHDRDTRSDRFDVETRLCHQVVNPMSSVAASTEPVRRAGFANVEGDFLEQPLRHEWTRWSRRRRSAKSFDDRPLPASALASIMGAVGTTMPTDIGHLDSGDTHPPRAHVSARLVLAPDAPAARESMQLSAYCMPTGVGRAQLVAACMRQTHVAQAQAFIVLYADREDLLPASGSHRLHAALFSAGAASQLACLGAARAGVGAFTVGGFVQSRWRTLSGLQASHDVLCVIALGSTPPQNELTERTDRLQRPYAQISH